MTLHKKDISKNLVKFIIVSNDNIFCDVINSIDVDISVLKINPDVNNSYNLVKIFKKVIPQLNSSNSSSLHKNNTGIEIKEGLKGLLSKLDENNSLEVIKLFEADLEKNSPRLCSELQSLVLKSADDGNQLFSSLSKLFRNLKNSSL